MAATSYRVVGPLAVVRDGAGKLNYWYDGAIVPQDTPAGEVERLAGRGLLEKVEAVSAEKPVKSTAAAKG
jgi:hypothetical protein